MLWTGRFLLLLHLRSHWFLHCFLLYRCGPVSYTHLNMIFLTFGTGLGSGLILNGQLYRGSTGMAGEAGHIRMENEGPKGYGKVGSLEGFCSGGGISRLAGYFGTAGSAKELAERAEAGDERALAVYARCGAVFGRGLDVYKRQVIWYALIPKES